MPVNKLQQQKVEYPRHNMLNKILCRKSRHNRDLRQTFPVHRDVHNPGEKRRQMGGECGWRRGTRARLQYLSAPESSGRQPRIRRDLNDPLPLDPQSLWIVGELLKNTVRERTVASSSDLTQAP